MCSRQQEAWEGPQHHGLCCLSTSVLSFSPFPEKNLLDPDHSDNYAAFKNWLQCYLVPGMSSLRDHNGRTIWFQVGVWGCCLGAPQPLLHGDTSPFSASQDPPAPQHYAVLLGVSLSDRLL